jgi:hypothetical protein
MACDICGWYQRHGHTRRAGEWRCAGCGTWWYGDDAGILTRVLDRDPTEHQMTQHEQVRILEACAFLRAQGQRFLVDFGWANALTLAEAAGFVAGARSR